MADTKAESLQVEERPEATHYPHHTLEIDQGNNAVLLDIRVDDEKGDAGSLKLAKDNHVRSVSKSPTWRFSDADIALYRPF
jgi:hypothetical protein